VGLRRRYREGFAVALAVAACTNLDGLSGGATEGGEAGAVDGPTDATTPSDSNAVRDSAVGSDALNTADASNEAAGDAGCSACAARVLVGKLGYASTFTVDATRVYWMSSASSGLFSADKATGADVQHVSGDVGYNLTTDPNALYWTNAVLTRMARDGGAGVPLTSPGFTIWGLALDPTSAYFTDFLQDGGLIGVPLDGGMPTRLASGFGYPHGVAIDATDVYFSTGGSLLRVPKGGGAVSTVVSQAGAVQDVALDAKSVYWFDQVGRVMQIDKGGAVATQVVLASAQTGTISIALGGGSVYWATLGPPADGGPPQGAVQRVPIGGGSTVVVASQQKDPKFLVSDGTAMYWLEQAGGAIWTVPQ
jgi:hypothetical protein